MFGKSTPVGNWRAFTILKEHHIWRKSMILTALVALILYGVPARAQGDCRKEDRAKVTKTARESKELDAEPVVAPWLLSHSGLVGGDCETATRGFTCLAEPETTEQALGRREDLVLPFSLFCAMPNGSEAK